MEHFKIEFWISYDTSHEYIISFLRGFDSETPVLHCAPYQK